MTDTYRDLLTTVNKAVAQSKAFREFQLKDKLSTLEANPLWVQAHNSRGVFYTIAKQISMAAGCKKEQALSVRLYLKYQTLFTTGLLAHLAYQTKVASKIFAT
jgi:hypothetical protein